MPLWGANKQSNSPSNPLEEGFEIPIVIIDVHCLDGDIKDYYFALLCHFSCLLDYELPSVLDVNALS